MSEQGPLVSLWHIENSENKNKAVTTFVCSRAASFIIYDRKGKIHFLLGDLSEY